MYYALKAAAAFSVYCKPDAHRYIFVCRPFFGQAGARARARDPPSGGGDAKPDGLVMADALSIAWHFTPACLLCERRVRTTSWRRTYVRVYSHVSPWARRFNETCVSLTPYSVRWNLTTSPGTAIPRYENLVNGVNTATDRAHRYSTAQKSPRAAGGNTVRVESLFGNASTALQSLAKVSLISRRSGEIRARIILNRASTARCNPFFTRRLYTNIFENRNIVCVAWNP